MAEEAPIALPEIEVSAQAPDTNTGRRDHDAAYETQPPAKPPAPQPKVRKPNRPDDTLTLVVAGQRFTGWQDVRITRGIEMMPSTFVLRVTERLPGSGTLIVIAPGQTCQVLMGADLVMTGYIDTYSSSVQGNGHTVTVTGRSKTQDLVDCAAGFKPGEESSAHLTFSASSLLVLANDLCAPFGITVTAPDGEGDPLVSIGDGIPQFTMALGQTPYEHIEPIARWRRLIPLDGPDGNLILAKVGTVKAASGFSLPGTVVRGQVTFTKQDRFSVYIPVQSAFDSAFNVSAALDLASANILKMVPDPAAFAGQPRADGKDRYRPHVVQSEQVIDGVKLAEERAAWQKGRDFGRSQAVTVEVSLWRDQAGTLWTPNTLAPVDMPVLKLKGLTWLISEVTYLRGRGGTRSIVTLMPAEAFAPMPDFYSAFDPKIVQALAGETRERAIRNPADRSFNPNYQQQTGGI